jgi:P4 family phage/plasmid primase-like protien
MPDAEAALRFLSAFFRGVEGQVFICSLPNAKGGSPGEKSLASRLPDEVSAFVELWDRPGRALYFCVSTLREDAKRKGRGSLRSKLNVHRLGALHIDIDFDKLAIESDNPQAEVMRVLESLACPPSIVVASGGGVHAYWLLEEPLALEAGHEAPEKLLRELATLVGGDPAVCEVARLMRLPGSTNSKRGDERPCLILKNASDGRYSLDELRAMLNAGAVLTFKSSRSPANDDRNRFEVYAAQAFKAPIDVEAELASMTPGNTHEKQLKVSASLLARGEPIEAVVQRLVEATAALKDGRDMRVEVREIRAMCESGLKFASAQAEELPEAEVIEMAPHRAKKQAAAEQAALAQIGRKAIARDAVEKLIEGLRVTGADIVLTGTGLHLYSEGLWHPIDEAGEIDLGVKVRLLLGRRAETRLLKQVREFLGVEPTIYKPEIEWDGHGLFPCANGLLDTRGTPWNLRPYAPDVYATRRGALAYDAEAGTRAPLYEQFLMRLFADRGDELADYVRWFEEHLGWALFPKGTPRELRKALWIVGPSRTGKTELAKLMRLTIGGESVAISIPELSDKFALQQFVGKASWVRDDAIVEGDRINVARFKSLVTGEPMAIRRMGKLSLASVSFDLAAIFTLNALPEIRDETDAPFNRSEVLTLSHVFPDGKVKEEFVPIEEIIAREGSAILNIALKARAQLLARGYYEIPQSMVEALREFRAGTSIVAAYLADILPARAGTAVVKSQAYKVFAAFEKEEEGGASKGMGQRKFFQRMKEAGVPWQRPHGRPRWYINRALSERGLDLLGDGGSDGGSGLLEAGSEQVNANQPME